MTDVVVFQDGTTSLAAAALDTLVTLGTCLVSGTTPSVPGSGLVLTYGQQQFVVQSNTAGADTGASIAFYTLTSGTLTVANNTTTYIDVSGTGTITQSTSTTQTSNTIRLWQVVSSGGNITSVTLLARLAPVLNSPTFVSNGGAQAQFINANPGGANFGVFVGETASFLNQGFISRIVPGSTTGLNGGSTEALLKFFHDGTQTSGSGHRKVSVTDRNGADKVTLDAGDGSVTALALNASGNIKGSLFNAALSSPTASLQSGAPAGAGSPAVDGKDNAGVVHLTLGGTQYTKGAGVLVRVLFANTFSVNAAIAPTNCYYDNGGGFTAFPVQAAYNPGSNSADFSPLMSIPASAIVYIGWVAL